MIQAVDLDCGNNHHLLLLRAPQTGLTCVQVLKFRLKPSLGAIIHSFPLRIGVSLHTKCLASNGYNIFLCSSAARSRICKLVFPQKKVMV